MIKVNTPFTQAKTILTFLLLLLCGATFAQDNTVTGVIKDDLGMTVPGATVLEKGTLNGTTTDMDGKFSIKVSDPKTAVLSVTFLGYAKQEIPVAGRSKIDVNMEPDVKNLEEAIVVGYGTTTKKEVTGASGKIKGGDVEKLNNPRVDQAIQGQVSGVSISTNSGSPGGSASIRIRGLSTFGDNDPLILVDGIIYDSEGLNALNPADIESVNILKDATAGIYGVRAANGVIIIETKKGDYNSAPKIDFNAYAGLQQPARKMDLLNATEYAVIKNETMGSSGEEVPFPNTALGEGTDWQDEVFQDAWVQSYSLSVNGGTKKTSYSIGGSAYSQDGIVGGAKSNFTRYNARINFRTDLYKNVKFTNVFLYSKERRKSLPENGIGSVLYNTVNAFPTETVKTPDGRYSYLEEVSDIINPVAQMANTHNQSDVNKFVGKLELEVKANPHITWTNRFNYNVALVDDKGFFPLVWYGPGKAQNTAVNAELDAPLVEIADSTFIERGASVYEARTTYTDLSGESFVNYNRTFKEKHLVKGTLGGTVFNRRGNQLNGTAYNIPENSVEYADISANRADGGYLNQTGSWEFEERLVSAFLRMEYGFKNRYLVSGILRGDGSSKFGENQRFGLFPTISAAWVFSDETFFKNWFSGDNPWISFAKLRVSYGIAGNDQIDNFSYRAALNGEGVYVFNDLVTQGVAIGRAANPDLKWETTRQFNIGVDLTIKENWDVSANFFQKKTKDLLFQPDVSGVMGTYGPGGQSPIINAGDVQNTGVELEIGYHTDRSKPLVFSGKFNSTYLKNKVLKVPDGVEFLPGVEFGVGGNVATRFEEGYAIGYFHGLVTDGVWQSEAEIENSPVKQPGAKPGDLKYKDLNGDGEINFSDDSDKQEIGSPIPDFTLGLILNFKYKKFDLGMNFFSALGQEIIRNYERFQPYANQHASALDRWTGPNTTNENPRVTTEPNRNTEFSDYYVEKGDFLRLRNVQLGYTIENDKLKKAKIQSLRVYFSINNLFTLTEYRGFDPEIGSSGGPLAAGVDYGFYPQARTYMFGTNFKF